MWLQDREGKQVRSTCSAWGWVTSAGGGVGRGWYRQRYLSRALGLWVLSKLFFKLYIRTLFCMCSVFPRVFSFIF